MTYWVLGFIDQSSDDILPLGTCDLRSWLGLTLEGRTIPMEALGPVPQG